MIDYHVELIKFPSSKTHEAVTINEDGSATIFLDQNDTKEQQQRRFLHALKHLRKDDFSKMSVQMVEAEAHGQGISSTNCLDEVIV